MSKKRPKFIEQILRSHSIVDYLRSHGIEPVTQGGQRLKYRCPMPSHNDSDPSFFVAERDGIEYYKCFGCDARGDIINLYCELEQASLRRAIAYFVKDLDIDEQEATDEILEQVTDRENAKYRLKEIVDFDLTISKECYNYVTDMEFDAEEIEKIERTLRVVDKAIRSMDIEELPKLENLIIDSLRVSGRRFYDLKEQQKL